MRPASVLTSVLASLVFVASLALLGSLVPSSASAQVGLYLPPPPTPEEIVLERHDELRDARAMRDTGIGMTLGGFLTSAIGTVALVSPAGFENWSGVIVGGLGNAMGGLSVLIGIPLWIVGSVRADIVSHRLEERAEVGWNHELAGIVTTLIGLGLLAIGGGLFGAGLASGDYDVRQRLMPAGTVVMPIGLFLATFIGPPMWGEGARF